MIKGIRNNARLLYKNLPLAQQYWQKAKSFIPSKIEESQAIGFNEQFRFYRYQIQQKFNKHRDGRFKRNDLEESRITFMIYLNEDFEGGETTFETLQIRPQTGLALGFIHELKHKACPVTSGTKYVLRTDVMYHKAPVQNIALNK